METLLAQVRYKSRCSDATLVASVRRAWRGVETLLAQVRYRRKGVAMRRESRLGVGLASRGDLASASSLQESGRSEQM